MAFNTPVTLLRIERIKDLLSRRYMTLNEIAEATHISVRWARAYLNHLHKDKIIYIAAYRYKHLDVKTVSHALYKLGSKEDAYRPLPLSSAQRMARQRKIINEDADLREKLLAQRRAARIKPRRDWTAAWIPTRTGAV